MKQKTTPPLEVVAVNQSVDGYRFAFRLRHDVCIYFVFGRFSQGGLSALRMERKKKIPASVQIQKKC